ncbi:MAG: NUDIX hydrolase [Nanoarchaeota archaeon]
MEHCVVGIIEKEDAGVKRYLLVASKKDFGKFTGFYYPPGGHLKPGEDEFSGLVREIQEELGIEVTSAKKIATTSSDVKDQVTHWYSCRVSSYEIKMDGSELLDASYFSREDMQGLRIWPATARFFEEFVFRFQSLHP